MSHSSVTAIVTSFKRVDQTFDTVGKIIECRPPPGEVIVHVDGGDLNTEPALKRAFPDIRILVSTANIGPGGGRNRLIAAASNELVASFDDDSYPVDKDYFERLCRIFESYPEAAIITGRVFHRNEVLSSSMPVAEWSADFCGGACAYRRSVFLNSTGYVPLPTAYGMEEVDLALRLRAEGIRILRTPWLRVFHDTDLKRHADPDVTAASIANLFLLTFLRYPITLWPIGLAQVFKRLAWLMTHGRRSGILSGLCSTPAHLYKNRIHRMPLSNSAVRSYLRLRRHPVPIPWPASLIGRQTETR